MLFNTPSLPQKYLQVIENIVELRSRLRHATSDNLNRWHGYLARLSYARLIHQSNTMEGVNATLDDAVAAVDGDEPSDPSSHAWRALTGHRDAMDYVIQISKEASFPYSEGTLLALHFMMMRHDLSKNPGRYRPGAVYVTNSITGKREYEAPPHEQVAALMQELIASLNARTNDNVLVRAAMAHLNLTMIHPFRDGNGRMARALQTLVLARDGILDPRFSSIEEYVGINALKYYEVLAEVGKGAWHPEHDALPWIKFCLRAHFYQAQRLLQRVEEIDSLWTELEKCIALHELPDRAIHALGRTAGGASIRSMTYRIDTQVSAQVAKKDLKLLVDKQLLVPAGEKRGRIYRASPILRDLHRKTRIERDIPDPFDDTVPQQRVMPGQQEMPI
jgi:Fic family protein